MPRFVVWTDAALARILGVTRPAIRKAELPGKITRRPDGAWDVFTALHSWRLYTHPLLQRPVGEFRPWLDPQVPLTRGIVAEIIRRARAEGAQEVLGWAGEEVEEAEDFEERRVWQGRLVSPRSMAAWRARTPMEATGAIARRDGSSSAAGSGSPARGSMRAPMHFRRLYRPSGCGFVS